MFVSSRRQTRLTALDLIAFLAAEEDPKQWLHTDEAELQQLLQGQCQGVYRAAGWPARA